jgi:hypothetical protein
MLGDMSGRLKAALRARWRLALFVALAVAVAAVSFVFGGVVAGAAVLLTAGGSLLLRERQKAEPRPEPSLELIRRNQVELHPSRALMELFDRVSGDEDAEPSSEQPGEEAGGLVFGLRRPVDFEAVAHDALERARANAPGEGALENYLTMSQEYAPPNETDHELFDQLVDEYEAQLRDWLEQITEPLSSRAAVGVFAVELRNPGEIDAEKARVVLRFPASFAAAAVEQVPEPPQAPAFPRRPSLFRQMSEPLTPHFGPSAGIALATAYSRRNLERIERSVGEPDYTETVEGLEVDYGRAPIHHGEIGSPGNELQVSCSEPGEHEVLWQIHARNMPEAARDSLRVGYRDEEVGDPVRTLADLEDLLVELGLAEPDE